MAESLSVFAMDDIDLESVLSSPRVNHRRVRSDPSDFMRSIRADQEAEVAGAKRELDSDPQEEDLDDTPAVKKQAADLFCSRPPSSINSDAESDDFASEPEKPKKRSIFSRLPFPKPSTSMFTPEELAQPKQPNYSKKDVPMWTVEEDLLILQLVEQHGKKWSKIASNLPGRTDNGVRNRWNRMERAQVLRKSRAPGAGYRCRRCGEPKRGHICAARTIGEDIPEGDELHTKAAALTELSAQAMQTIPGALGEEGVGECSADEAADDSSRCSKSGATPSPSPPPETSKGSASQPPASPGLSFSSSLPLPPAQPLVAPAGAPPLVLTPSALAPPPLSLSPSAAAAGEVSFSTSDVDAFLDELRRSLDDTTGVPDAPMADAPSAHAPAQLPHASFPIGFEQQFPAPSSVSPMRPADLQSAWAALTSDWGVDVPASTMAGVGVAF